MKNILILIYQICSLLVMSPFFILGIIFEIIRTGFMAGVEAEELIVQKTNKKK